MNRIFLFGIVVLLSGVYCTEVHAAYDFQKCTADTATRQQKEAEAFQKQLDVFAAMQDVPTKELGFRAKTALLNFGNTLEEICLANILPNSIQDEKIRIDSCRIDADSSAIAQNNYQVALDSCFKAAVQLQEKYEFIIMNFLEKDVLNKMTYTYAQRIQELALAMRSVNEDFSYVENAISYIVSQVTAIIHGKNAGK